MTDRTTKLLLGLIAAGLWANIVSVPAGATQDVGTTLWGISLDLAKIANGTCLNRKICE